METGEIDSLFTELSNSVSGTKPPAGQYGEARFQNLIDAALVARAISQGTIVPDNIDGLAEVEAAFTGLLADEGNGTAIEFGWKDWADGFYGSSGGDLYLYIGDPGYKAVAKKTHVKGEVVIKGPGTIARDTVGETEGLFTVDVPDYLDFKNEFKWTADRPLTGIRLEQRGAPDTNMIAVVVEPQAVIPQGIKIKADWMHPDGSIIDSGEITVSIVADQSLLTVGQSSVSMQIYTDSPVTVKVSGVNLGPTRKIKFADPGVLPPAGVRPNHLPLGVVAGGDFEITDGKGEGELILSGIPEFTGGRKRNISITVSLEALGIAGVVTGSFDLALTDPPPPAVTKPDQASPVPFSIRQGGSLTMDFETENLTVSDWKFTADKVIGLPPGVTVGAGSGFTNSTATGKGSGRLQLNAAVVPVADTGRHLPITVNFPDIEGKFNLQVETVAIDSVTLSPDRLENIKRGGLADFSATVTGNGWDGGNVPQGVNWAISGTQPHTSAISNSGSLMLAQDEPNSVLTVRAVSVIDGSVYGEANVSIAPTVRNVVISPKNTGVDRGSNATFTAKVEGYGNPPQDVVWYISGALDSGTRIDGRGNLRVSKAEKSDSITVRATSVLDLADFPDATASVAVTGAPGVGDWSIIQVGIDHTMGIRYDGTLWTWGRNARWLGIGTAGDHVDRPRQVGTGKDWVSVAGGLTLLRLKRTVPSGHGDCSFNSDAKLFAVEVQQQSVVQHVKLLAVPFAAPVLPLYRLCLSFLR